MADSKWMVHDQHNANISDQYRVLTRAMIISTEQREPPLDINQTGTDHPRLGVIIKDHYNTGPNLQLVHHTANWQTQVLNNII